MKTSKFIFICFLTGLTTVNAQGLVPLVYSNADFDDWYYKKTDTYKGWKYIVIHHSATQAGSVKAFERYHTQQGYGGVAYHFVIGNGNGMQDGEVQATFRWQQQIAGTHVTIHSWDHNVFGIGICLVGNLDKTPPTKAQMEALMQLIAKLRKTHGIESSNIIGHRHVAYDDASGRTEQTHCPGKKIDVQQLLN